MSPLSEKFPEPRIERISSKTIGASILAVLNLERGILYTIWALIKNPGEAMRRYLFIDRTGFIDPLKFLVLAVAIYLFLSFGLFPETNFVAGFREGFENNSDKNTEARAVLEKIISMTQQYANLVMLITVPLAALFTWLIFKKYRLNFGEHLVLNAYLYSFLTLVSAALIPLSAIKTELMSMLTFLLYLIYVTYFLRSFFRMSWGRALANNMLIQIYSLFSFILMIVIISLISIATIKS